MTIMVGATLAPPTIGRADADPIGRCTRSVGTIVAVDFGHWGGPIVRGCGLNDPSGIALLHAAGFSTAGDEHDGPAFVCRLGNQSFHYGTQYPTPRQDPCIVTPPATAYWSYWLAPAGQDTWSYSQSGAMSDHPQPGEVEFWEFGGTNVAGTQGSGVPSVSPNSLRATNAKPITTKPITTKPTTTKPITTKPTNPTSASSSPTKAAAHSASPTQSPASAPSSSAPSTAAVSRTTSAASITSGFRQKSTHHPTSSASAGRASAAPSSDGSTPDVIDAQPAAARSNSSGSATGLVVGVVLVAVLGGGAGWGMRRRRQWP